MNGANLKCERHNGEKFSIKIKKLFSNNKRSRDLLFYMFMMALPILQFVIMYIGVNFNSILLAFKQYDLNTGEYAWLGFDNFVKAFEEMQTVNFLKTIENSLVLFGVSIAISLPIGIIFSFYIYKKFPANKFFRVALYLTCIVSSIVMVTIYNSIMEMALTQIIEKLTGQKVIGFVTNPETTRTTLLFYTIFFSFGSTTMVISSSMSSINTSVIEASKLDGCNLIQEFFLIVFPLSFNVIKLQLITAIVGIFTAQLELFTFFGLEAYPKNWTLGYYLYREILFHGPKQYPYYAAMGLCFSFVAVPIVLAFRKLFDRLDPSIDKEVGGKSL